MVPPITFYAPVYSHKLDAQPRLLFLWSDVDTRHCTSFLGRCEPEGEKVMERSRKMEGGN